jgi:hypothetical protein
VEKVDVNLITFLLCALRIEFTNLDATIYMAHCLGYFRPDPHFDVSVVGPKIPPKRPFCPKMGQKPLKKAFFELKTSCVSHTKNPPSPLCQCCNVPRGEVSGRGQL